MNGLVIGTHKKITKKTYKGALKRITKEVDLIRRNKFKKGMFHWSCAEQ